MPEATVHGTGPASSETVVWMAVIVGLVLLTGSTMSLVPRGERRVVIRRGLVRRVVESGVAWRVPILDRVEAVLSASLDLPVTVRATTIDGVPVLVLLETVVEVLPPMPGHPYADPWPAAEEIIQGQVSSLVSRLPVVQLRHALRAAEGQLLHAIRAPVRRLGVELQSIEVVEIDLPLTSDRGPD